MPTIPTRQRHKRISKSGLGSMVEILISVNFIRLKMSSMKLIAIIAESINIDVTEMKKGRLFFIRTPQFFFSTDFHTLFYNPHTEFLLPFIFQLSHLYGRVKL